MVHEPNTDYSMSPHQFKPSHKMRVMESFQPGDMMTPSFAIQGHSQSLPQFSQMQQQPKLQLQRADRMAEMAEVPAHVDMSPTGLPSASLLAMG